MDLPASLLVVRCLARDTFRQSLASRAFWLALGLTGLCVLLCLSVRLEGYTAGPAEGEIGLFGPDDQPFTGQAKGAGTVSVGFGAIHLPQFRDGPAEVAFLQAVLAKWVGGAVGLLLVLLWTGGFLPEFLDPRSAAVLLAKPVPRWGLLAGKFLGVLAVVAAWGATFLAATWLALGARSGVWDGAYFLCLPVLLLHFAVFFSFSALLAVATRNAAACVFGSALFWVLCSATNLGRHAAHSVAELRGVAPHFGRALELAYWVLPKPLDFHAVLLGTLGAEDATSGLVSFPALAAQGAWSPAASLTASALCGLALLVCAAYDFLKADY
jgi:ABC-type transport system involved in multi-copper enzyme maturation permease subunit